LYCALFAPTLALGNSLSLHHLLDSKTGFPRVKIWSAVGWIGGGVTLSVPEGRAIFDSVLSGRRGFDALGIFSLLLPHTAAQENRRNVSVGEVLGLDALAADERRRLRSSSVPLSDLAFALFLLRDDVGLSDRAEVGSHGREMSLAQVSDVFSVLKRSC